MKKIALLVIISITGSVVTGQEVISSAGNSQTASEIEVSWTLGEVVIETHSSGSSILTQGFHQTKLTVTHVPGGQYAEIDVDVFPNPTHDIIIVQFDKLLTNTGYSLFDITGKVLEKKLITANRTHVHLNDYAPGLYILKLTKEENQLLQTFQILKE